MTSVTPGVVYSEDLSTGWLETVRMVAAAPQAKMFHTLTSIGSPCQERPAIRSAIEATLRDRGLPGIETVANTIFPSALAGVSSDHEELADRYRAMYPTLRKFPGNHQGTYFGRIVAHPDSDPPLDQLSPLIDRLRREAASPGPMSARYEVSVAGQPDTTVLIRSPRRDTSRRGFPCLALCSFHLDDRRVHLLAQYRYEFLIEKGYGNYLGLARLQRYVADQAGLQAGRLTVVAGRVQVDSGRRQLEAQLKARDPDG